MKRTKFITIQVSCFFFIFVQKRHLIKTNRIVQSHFFSNLLPDSDKFVTGFLYFGPRTISRTIRRDKPIHRTAPEVRRITTLSDGGRGWQVMVRQEVGCATRHKRFLSILQELRMRLYRSRFPFSRKLKNAFQSQTNVAGAFNWSGKVGISSSLSLFKDQNYVDAADSQQSFGMFIVLVPI